MTAMFDNSTAERDNSNSLSYKEMEKRLPPLSRKHCETLISNQIGELAQSSDFVVVVIYDREQGSEPIGYTLYDFKKNDKPQDVPTALNFEGIWVWYFCNRSNDVFNARKLLIEIEDGHYVSGQFGDFEGFWDEFPNYVTQDRWIKSAFNTNVSLSSSK